MDNSANTPTSSSNFEEYNIRVFVIVCICLLVAFAMVLYTLFCMMRATVGQGENSFVGFRATNTTSHQCRHTCPVNNKECRALLATQSDLNRHEKNVNVHSSCSRSACTVLEYHDTLDAALAYAEQLKKEGPPRARRLSSLGAGSSRANYDDDGSGDEAVSDRSISTNGTKRRRRNASEPKSSDAEIVMNNVVDLIKDLQPRSGARRPLIAALFSGVNQEHAAAALDMSRSTIQRAFADARGGEDE